MQAEIRPGYKQTEAGVIPEDWDVVEAFELEPFITSGSRGWAKYYSDRGSLFLRITNLSRTWIYPDFSDQKLVEIPEGDTEGQRTSLQDGDVLISITADIGVVGYVGPQVPKPAYINQHIACLRLPARKTDSLFQSYYLASQGPQKRFMEMTDIGAKSGINLTTIGKLKLLLPPLPEQRAIAATLADADALIAALEGVIAKKRDLKQAAMQQLLTGKTRLPSFSGEWEVKRLGDLLEYEQPTKYLVSSTDYDDSYDIPVLTAGKTFLLGHTNEDEGVFDQLPVIIFDDFTTATQFVDFPFKSKSSAMKLLKPRNPQVNLRLVYDMMQTIEFVMSDHKRYWISEYQNIEVPFPDPAEQTAIAEILSDMDADLEALGAQLAKARAVKQGMMQQLLTGKVRLV